MSTVAKKKPEWDIIAKCAQGIAARIEALGIKGKKRQTDEAIAYAVGYAMALNDAGFDISILTIWTTFDLAFHGMVAVKRAVEE